MLSPEDVLLKLENPAPDGNTEELQYHAELPAVLTVPSLAEPSKSP